MNEILHELGSLLTPAAFDWALCGGLALDLFLGRETRPHSDIDISVSEEDRAAVTAFFLSKGWQVYQYLGQGLVRLITVPGQSERGRNLMCLQEGCELVKFYPAENGQLYHEMAHVPMTKLDFLDVLFHTGDGERMLVGPGAAVGGDREKAVLQTGSLRYLAPEAALLYKASDPESSKNQADFENVFPLLEEEQRRWLYGALAALYPEGHPWSSR